MSIYRSHALRVGLILSLLLIGLVSGPPPVDAQAPNFDGSYKTGPATANTNDLITYTIVVSNSGALAQNVVLSDILPNASTFIPGSCSYDRGAGPQPCLAPPGQMWQEDLDTGDRITTHFQVQVTAGTMQWPLVNCFRLSWNGNQWGSDQQCVTTIVNPQPTPTPTTPPPGPTPEPGPTATPTPATPPPPPSPCVVGSPWQGEYFDSRWPGGRPALTRQDPHINFDWGTGSPDTALPADNFSVRWEKNADFGEGVYEFWVVHDDGARLWVDGQLVLNQWYDQPACQEGSGEIIGANRHSVELAMTAGSHRLALDYYEHGKRAVVKLGCDRVAEETSPAGFATTNSSTADTLHRVQPGEWLYQIARDYGVSVGAIIEANSLTFLGLVPGQVLIIPQADASSPDCAATYTVQAGDNLFRIGLRFGVPLAALAAENGLQPPYTIIVGQTLCLP